MFYSFNVNKKSNIFNSMQIFIHCKTTLYVSGVTATIIRSIKNYTRSLRYRSYYLYRYSPPTWSDRFLILLMMVAVTPETYRVVLQWINICILLHMLDFIFTLNYDARNHEFKVSQFIYFCKTQVLVLVWQIHDAVCGLGLVCSQTQLCHIGVFNDYIEQLDISAFTGHLQVVLREQT